MDSDEHDEHTKFEIGDIVGESEYIKPPDRTPWTGIVVYIDNDFYELHSYLGQFEDLIAIHWFQSGYIESLPASVIRMIQKANKKK
jgi:hypothetical protein|tara:strand:+ start:368 stop:625 length:258 start_codon:yes stop_codon:yes gene_type:complete